MKIDHTLVLCSKWSPPEYQPVSEPEPEPESEQEPEPELSQISKYPKNITEIMNEANCIKELD